ncbi:hypothetical protein R1flu_026277 [Riccia fluitans]|uniref:Uncharacterized protein n=1 Tax=Riccia fluitans TaxID=41844 RepID=A0ABD1XFH0_9MARC
MVETTEAAAAVPSSSERGETISKIQEGMVTLLDNFLAPCLGQVQEGVTELRAPTLETISLIMNKQSWNIVVPPSLAQALTHLESGGNKQETSSDDGESYSSPDLSRDAVLEIVERLRKSNL